jgi:hypothetical protein
MGSMKGAGPAVSEITQWAFMVLVAGLLIYILVQWSAASEASLQNVEQASLMYTLAGSVNALSVEDIGRMEIDLKHAYDIGISCGTECRMTITGSGEEKGEEKSFILMGSIQNIPLELKGARKVCLEKGYEGSKDGVVVSKC